MIGPTRAGPTTVAVIQKSAGTTGSFAAAVPAKSASVIRSFEHAAIPSAPAVPTTITDAILSMATVYKAHPTLSPPSRRRWQGPAPARPRQAKSHIPRRFSLSQSAIRNPQSAISPYPCLP